MNFKSLMTKFGFLILLLTLVTGASFAQTTWYVNNTNGDDLNNDGKASSQVTATSGPFKTIGTAVLSAHDGDIISVACDTYNETLTIDKAVTMVATAFQSRTTVIINNGITINAAGKTINMGRVADGSLSFTLKGAKNLVLADGTFIIDAANVIIEDGGKIERKKNSATINVTPTVTNVDVIYSGSASITTGKELPANLGTGSLYLSNTAGTVTVSSDVTLSEGNINFTDGNATFNGNVNFVNTTPTGNTGGIISTAAAAKVLTFNYPVTFNTRSSAGYTTGAITNGAGKIDFKGAISFVDNNYGAGGGVTGTITNGTGTLILGTLTMSSNNTIALTNGGKLTLAGGTVNGAVTNTAGTITLAASTNFSGASIDNGATIQLNGNILTVSDGSTLFSNTGKIISTTASEVGTGKVIFTYAGGNVTITGTGELPNVEVKMGDTRELLLADIAADATLSLYGDLTLTSGVFKPYDDTNIYTLDVKGNIYQNGGELNFGTGTAHDAVVKVAKDFIRTNGTFEEGHGKLLFAGSANQTFTPGSSLELYDVEINNPTKTVTLNASVIVNHNFTITRGILALGTYNVRMQGGAFVNGTDPADGYTSVGGGGVIFETAASTIDGTGVFSNLDVRNASTVTLSHNVAVSGVVRLRSGNFVTGANTLTLSDKLTIPSVEKYAATSTINGNVAVTSTYNLRVLAPAAVTAANFGGEFSAASAVKLNDLEIKTTGAAHGATLPAVPSKLVGTLTVDPGQTLVLDAGAANFMELAGNSKVHSVYGSVTTGLLKVTGSSVQLNGSTEDADAAAINALTVALADGASFSSADLKLIDGDLTIGGGKSASIVMNRKSAKIDNTTTEVNCPDGTVTIDINAETPVHNGSISLKDGILNYTGKETQTITGSVTLEKGKLSLGSAVSVTSTTEIKDAELANGTYDYTSNGAFTHSGTGTFSGTGKLVLKYAGAGDLTLGKPFSVANLVLNAGGAVKLVTDDLTVTNALTITQGTFDLNSRKLVVAGNTFNNNVSTGATSIINGTVQLTGDNLVVTSKEALSFKDLEVNSTGKVVFVSDKETASTPVARTFSTTGLFTQTAGDVYLGINTLSVSDFTRKAGNWFMGSGKLVFNGVGEFTPGVGFAVDNLEVSGGQASNETVDVNPFTVNKSLLLVNDLNAGDDKKLVLGNGVTIERKGGLLSKKPTFGNSVNLIYSGGISPLDMANEIPSTDIINNLTVSNPAVVNLVSNIKVNGTLSLAKKIAKTAGDYTISMGDNSTLELKDAGTNVLDKDLKRLGKLNLIYAAAVTTSTRELGTKSSGVYTTAVTGDVTVKGKLTLDGSVTFAGKLTLDGADIAPETFNVNVNGDFVQKTANFFENKDVYINFGGNTNTVATLKANLDVPASLKLRIAKASSTNTVTLVGGGLNFATNGAKPYFLNGLLVTGTNVVVLKQDADAGKLQPIQGYDMDNTGSNKSFVVGNVQKYITNAAGANNDISRSIVTFPVGNVNAEYRPLNIYFKTAPQSSVNLTVNHVNAKAGGYNGFPITAGTKQITNYPGFFWYVKSDIALAPSYKYDMDAQAEGYTDYKEGIQNIRFVRRDSGDVANNWVLQGADNAYDNSAITASKPVVKVIDAMGGITSQGSIFTYSQANKAPVFAAADHIGNVTKAEGDTLTQVFKATDPDFGQKVTLSKVQIPDGSTFDPATGKFSWIIGYAQAGKQVVAIKATDDQGASYTTSDTITVTNTNRVPTIAKMGKTNVAEGTDFKYQYVTSDPDLDTVKVSMVVSGDATSDTAKISKEGLLTWKPGFGNAGKTAILTVNATDGTLTATVVDTIVVTKTNRAPVFAVKTIVDTTSEGQAYTKTFVATDADGTTPTYKIVANTDTTAKIDAATGVFTWTPSYKSHGTHSFKVTASDGSLADTASFTLVVKDVNVAPTFAKVLPTQTVAVGDTVKFQYTAEDLDGDALTFGLENAPQNAKIDAATGLFTWIPESNQTAIYVIKATVTDGPNNPLVKVSTEVLVKVVNGAVAGKVTYDNSTVAVPGVIVKLTQGTTVLTDTTDATGSYSFDNVTTGTYTVTASKTAANFDAVNATDALLAALYSVDPVKTPLTDAQKLAANVVGKTADVNASDAMAIVQKFVDPATKFECADWLFIPQQSTFVVGSKAVTNNLTAILAGDVDRTMAKGSIAKEVANTTVNNGEVLKIAPKATFALPIKVQDAAKLGAVSLQISYPADLVKFEGVSGVEGLVAKANNGVITLGWFNAQGMSFKADDVLASLKFSATEKFAKGQSFSAQVVNNSEIVDANGKVQATTLKIANVEASVPQVFALNQNYPNPFNPTTTIAYDLPVDGKVTLDIYNSLGQVVTTLVNEIQTAGTYKYNWNAASMSSGVYYYRITVEGQKGFSATHKMILMK